VGLVFNLLDGSGEDHDESVARPKKQNAPNYADCIWHELRLELPEGQIRELEGKFREYCRNVTKRFIAPLLQQSSIRLEQIASIWGPDDQNARLTTLKEAAREERLKLSYTILDNTGLPTKLNEVYRAELRRYAMTPEPPLDKSRLIAWCDLWDGGHAPGTIDPAKIEDAKRLLGLAPSARSEVPSNRAAESEGTTAPREETSSPPSSEAEKPQQKRGGGLRPGPWYDKAVVIFEKLAKQDRYRLERMEAEDLYAVVEKASKEIAWPSDAKLPKKKNALDLCLRAREKVLAKYFARSELR
jgi:hypothetical protein